MSFITGTQAELLYTLTSSVTKNTYTTEAAFSGVAGTNTVCSLPAGFFLNTNPNPVGRTLKLEAGGTIANTAGATFAVNLGLDATAGTKGGTGGGSTTVYAATAPTASTTTVWQCHAWMTVTVFTTSAYTVQVNGFWTQSATASGAALGTAGLRTDFQSTIASLDPRILLYVELFGTWSASSASNTTTMNMMNLWGLN